MRGTEGRLAAPQPNPTQQRSPEGNLTSIIHEFSSFEDAIKVPWETTDELYHCLENLVALQISILFVSPDFQGKEKAWVETIAWRLRLLRGRKNFSLTFTVQGEVVPWVAVVPSLSFELQLQVIGHLEWGAEETRDRMRTLVACCLVCRAWFRVCQKALLGNISLFTLEQFRGLVSTLTSSIHTLCASVVKVRFIGDTADCFYRMAPFQLATKLPSLQYLVIDGGDHPFTDLHWQHKARLGRTYLGHSSLCMHLRQFESVTELRLSHITFQSFWDLRRFIVALPALSNLHIDRVDFPCSDPFRRPDGRIPSLFSGPQKLTQFSITVPVGWNPLWVWVLPSQTRYQKFRHPLLHPSLTLHEAETIWKLVTLEKDIDKSVTYWHYNVQFCFMFHWSHDERHQQCKLTSTLRNLP